MKLVPLTLPCPQCGSNEVTYTCEPKCCFNHVCNHCHASFEPVTRRVGELPEPLAAPALADDALRPTAGCPRCQSIRVFRLEGDAARAGQLVCADCRALLELSFEGVEQN